jgi:hypothetical protein
MGDPNNPDGYEVKHTDLSGIIFDIAAHGWASSQNDPGLADKVVYPSGVPALRPISLRYGRRRSRSARSEAAAERR